MIDCYWLDARRDLKVSEVFHEIVGEIERLKADVPSVNVQCTLLTVLVMFIQELMMRKQSVQISTKQCLK